MHCVRCTQVCIEGRLTSPLSENLEKQTMSMPLVHAFRAQGWVGTGVCVCVCVCVCSKYHMYISSELLALLHIYIHDAIDRFS